MEDNRDESQVAKGQNLIFVDASLNFIKLCTP